MTVARNLSLLSPNVSTSGTVNNAGLTNSSITINGTAVALGGTGSLNSADSFSVNSLNIATNATPAVFVKDDNLTSWDYSGKSFSLSGQETTPAGIFFKPDGLAMYVVGQSGDDVNQYSLSTAWDVSTAAFVRVSAVIGETGPTGIFFKPDGTVMYITGFTNDTVREFSLSTAWDVSTIAFVRDFSVAAQDTVPQDIWFKPDGTKVYIVGSTNDGIYEYNLSTAWNISTASFVQFFSVAAQDTIPIAITFNPDGTKMYVLGDAGDDINRYSLSTPWNISTAVFFNNFYVGFQEASPQGLFINFDSGTAYVVGSSTDAVYQYTTITDGIELLSSSGLFIDGSLYTNKNLLVTGKTRLDGTLSVSGATTLDSTLSVGSSTTLGSNVTMATTTGVVNLGTSQTTGTWTAGGTAQTGAITLGQSTVSQTTSIQAGATASGSTKTIAIGTGGLAGSTTAITIGSTTGTNTITANGNWTFPSIITGSITGTAANVTGTVAIANGGTGATSAAAALTNLGAYAATNPNGYTTNTGTVTSVSATAPIVSSGGTAPAISISAATTLAAGSMSAADKTKLDGIAAGATANTGTVTGVTGTAPVVSSGGTSPAISMAAATSTVNGYMTSTYAAKLDGIAAGATANTGTVTGVTGTAPVVSSGGTAPAISMAAATSTVNGYMTSTYAAKLDGIAAGATANTGTVTSVSTGTGLTGGPITTTGTISLANTAVTAGSYTLASITVDAQGRITAASSGSAGGVTSFSAGTTGLTPSTATTGAVTLAGTLAIANGGTGNTSGTATNATNVAITNDAATATSQYVTFVGSTSGNAANKVHSTGLLFVPSTGALTASGNVTAYSDERLKTNWSTLPVDFIQKLARVKSGTYTRIDSGERQAGSSAQEWQILLPEVVQQGTDTDKTLALAYGNAALVSAVELAKRVVDQEARIAKLESIINSLKK